MSQQQPRFPPPGESMDIDHNTTFGRRILKVRITHLLLISLTLALAGVSLASEAIFALHFACCVFTVLSAWLIVSWSWCGGRVLGPYGLFLVAALLFNGGQMWICAFDSTASLLHSDFDPEVALNAVILVTESMMFLHLGAIMTMRPSRIGSIHATDIEERGTSRIGWFLFAIAVVPAVMSMQSATQAVMLHGYFALYQREVAAGMDAAPELIARMLVPATFLIFAGNLKKPVIRAFCICTLVVFACTQLFLGVRSAAVMPLVAFAWLWERCVGRVRRSLAVAATGVALFLLPAIAIVRDVSGADRTSATFLLDALSRIDNPAEALVYEMGGSMSTVAHTLDLVPSLRAYDLGASYLYAGLAIVPNVFGDPIHPASAHGSLAKWLVENVDPVFAALGGGFGFSFIAEGYANFGWFGAQILMVLLGAGIQLLANWADKVATPSRQAMVATVISFLLFLPRSESVSVARPLVWYGLLPYLLVRCVAAWTRHSRGPTSS